MLLQIRYNNVKALPAQIYNKRSAEELRTDFRIN